MKVVELSALRPDPTRQPRATHKQHHNHNHTIPIQTCVYRGDHTNATQSPTIGWTCTETGATRKVGVFHTFLSKIGTRRPTSNKSEHTKLCENDALERLVTTSLPSGDHQDGSPQES